jgi:biopolymer transport protein ExbD
MAMSVGPSDGGEENKPMSDINTTPLVDVMLVLLIIFLITVPAIIQKVPVVLPKVVLEPTTTKPENVSLSIRVAANGTCEIFWGMTKVNSTQLINLAVNKLKYEIHKQEVQGVPIELPEAHIRGDINTPYRCIGGAIFTMQRAGFARVGFISEPPAGYVTERL